MKIDKNILISLNVNIKELKKIVNKFKLNLIILFGSTIQNSTSEFSDIDIAILSFHKKIDVTYENSLLSSFVELFRRDKIDLIILNYADPLLQYEIAKTGIPIYERSKANFNKFQVQAMKEHNDAQKFYKLDKIYIQNFLKGVRSDVIKKSHPPKIV